MRGRTLLVSLAFALVIAGGSNLTYSSFTAAPVSVGSSRVGIATLASFVAVQPGTDTQPGSSVPVATGAANALVVDLGNVPSARTFASVFTVTNTTGSDLPLTLTASLPAEASSIRFVASGTSTIALAPRASTAVAIETSPAPGPL